MKKAKKKDKTYKMLRAYTRKKGFEFLMVNVFLNIKIFSFFYFF